MTHLLIQIYFGICRGGGRITRKIQFCKKNEGNLHTLYEISREAAAAGRRSLEQLLVLCAYHIANETRKSSAVQAVEQKLLDEFSRYGGDGQVLKDVSWISIEARIDKFPKRTMALSHAQLVRLLE